MNRITILKIKDLGVMVIKKNPNDDFFITTNDSVIIPIFNFSSLLKYMLFKEIVSPKLLQSIVDDYISSREH